MTDKPSREDVRKLAKECGFAGAGTNVFGITDKLECFAAAMYAAGAEAMRERAAGICHRFGDREMHPHECEGAIRATHTSGEQTDA